MNTKSTNSSSPESKQAACAPMIRFGAAYSVDERIKMLQTTGMSTSPTLNSKQQANQIVADWKSEPPFDLPHLFSSKLESAGISENRFTEVLATPVDHFEVAGEPAWIKAFEEAFHEFGAAETVYESPDGAKVDFAKILSPANPLVARGIATLKNKLQALTNAKANAERVALEMVVETWLHSIRSQLARMLARTVALEIGAARLSGELKGETPEGRYHSFFAELQKAQGALHFWQEYPVLCRQITELIDVSIDVVLEFFTHLFSDWTAIEKRFFDETLQCITAISLGQGDSHAGGHGVIVIEFNGGRRIVYKPRSLAVEEHFQQLLSWLNERGTHPDFRTLEVLDCGDHGWVEYVQAEKCADVEQMKRFFVRQGGLLAVFYALHANDLHSQNLIACGEHPVVIDLETLFHPMTVRADTHPLDTLLHEANEQSVMKTGLLPQRSWANGSESGVDISGIGGGEKQLAPSTTLCWDAPGTDQMRITRDRFEMAAENNRPSLESGASSPYEFREQIAEGFESVYELLVSQRDALLGSDGPLARFANDQVRVILRDTRTYAVLLEESYHPDFLRNAIDRDRLFDRLWLRTVNQPHLAQAIEAEQFDLQHRDIPFFTTSPGQKSLIDSRGRCLENFFDLSGLEVTRQRIAKLCQHDLDRQLWFVKSALATLGSKKQTRATVNQSHDSRVATSTSSFATELLDEASNIGDRLEKLAVRSGGLAAWHGIDYRNDGWAVDICGLDLYDGLGGIALFLSYLGKHTGERRHTELADSAVSTLLSFFREDYQPPGIGGFSGLGGAIYSLTHLGANLHRSDLLELAKTLATEHQQLIEDDDQFDIVSGAAGCMLGLLALDSVCPSDEIVEQAIRCGELLLRSADREGDTASWTAGNVCEKPLAGFSHGAGGIAHALLELSERTGDVRFLATAKNAFQFEQTLYSAQHQNWLDRRSGDADHGDECGGYMTAWCHGAPGVGLSRLNAFGIGRDEASESEIRAAVNSTLKNGFGANLSLCHGDLGNLAFLRTAADRLCDEELSCHVSRLGRRVLQSIHAQGYRCGIPVESETPGLMSGLAGIGYGLLFLARPHEVPNILCLEAPAKKQTLVRPFQVPETEVARTASAATRLCQGQL